MADIQEVFKIIEDEGTGNGEALRKRQEGDAAAGQNGSIGFAFKDDSGNVVLPALTSDGKIPVDTETAAGTVVRGRETLVSGSVTAGSDNDVVTLTLTPSQQYSMSDYMGSTTRICKWTLVQNDNGSETILDVFFTGPGQYSFSENPKNLSFSSGATGTQELILRGNPLNTATDLHGRVSIIDLP